MTVRVVGQPKSGDSGGSLIYPNRPFRPSMGCTGLIKVKCGGDTVEPVGGVQSTIHPSAIFRSDISRVQPLCSHPNNHMQFVLPVLELCLAQVRFMGDARSTRRLHMPALAGLVHKGTTAVAARKLGTIFIHCFSFKTQHT
jgi:hypothetical protein